MEERAGEGTGLCGAVENVEHRPRRMEFWRIREVKVLTRTMRWTSGRYDERTELRSELDPQSVTQIAGSTSGRAWGGSESSWSERRAARLPGGWAGPPSDGGTCTVEGWVFLERVGGLGGYLDDWAASSSSWTLPVLEDSQR